MYPLVRLVSSPDTGAEVRFDFHDPDVTWSDQSTWDFGVPELLGEPGGVGAEYGKRRLTFTLYIGTHRAAALAAQSRLARELMREESWLAFQLSASDPPMWFKVYASSPGAVEVTYINPDDFDDDVWALNVSLVADPFAIGAPVPTALSLSNDPAAGSAFRAVSNVKGDAPAPLNVINASAYHTFGLLSVSSVPPLWSQAESLALTSGTVTAADAGASGGSVAKTTPTSTANAQRLRWLVDSALSSTDYASRSVYGSTRVRVFAAVSFSASTDTWALGVAAGTDAPKMVNVDPRSGRLLVDLGTASLSRNTGSAGRPSGGLLWLNFFAQRSGGTGTVSWDVVYVVPCEQIFTWGIGEVNDSARSTVVDGEHEQVFAGTDSAGLAAFAERQSPGPQGDFVKLVPGQTNYLLWLTGSNLLPQPFVPLTNTAALTVTYRGQFLYLASP